MDELKNKKLFWVLVIVTIFNVGAFIVGKVIVDRAADRVIQKLQKEYSPSPYGPGFDPDKVSPNAFKSQKLYFESRKRSDSKIFSNENLREGYNSRSSILAAEADEWREDWEKLRGVRNLVCDYHFINP